MLVGELAALGLQAGDLVLDIDLGVRGHVPQLLDLRFELGDRLFEIQKRDGHGESLPELRRPSADIDTPSALAGGACTICTASRPTRPSSCSSSSRLGRTIHSAPRLSAPRRGAARYSMVIGQGPPRQGVRIAARRSVSRAVSACGAAHDDAPRLLLAQLVELDDAPRGEPPGVAELIEAQRALDEHQRVLDDELAMPLEDLLEQRDLDAPGAVIQDDADARAALADLIDQPGHRRPCRPPLKRRVLDPPPGGRSPMSPPMRCDTNRGRSASKRAMGWPVRYSPSVSRSPARRYRLAPLRQRPRAVAGGAAWRVHRRRARTCRSGRPHARALF